MGLTQTGLKTADYALTAVGILCGITTLLLWISVLLAGTGAHAAAFGMSLITAAVFGVDMVIERFRN